MIHFISGLPRSGSTLLASLLRQNPRFSAQVQSPLGQLVTAVLEQMSTANESFVFMTANQRLEILRGVFKGYYLDHPEIVFDSNRRWCAHMPLLQHLFPGSKVIACVRPVAEIVDSFERLFQRDPTLVSKVITDGNTTLVGRINKMMAPNSVIGFSYNALQDAYFGALSSHLVLLEFRHLVNDPIKALKDLHAIIEEPWFEYDIEAVESPPRIEIFDELLGTPGMHWVSRKVERRLSSPVLPAPLTQTLPQPFWMPHAEKDSAVKDVR